ncbi:MAG: phospho-N-acetylmuramoyl-pentapeptide-transferase [Clostridia bacterium]|nr:phospho-N-acetylmuramoyl-pentapeptide-transferase [Clostridia bacterium]
MKVFLSVVLSSALVSVAVGYALIPLLRKFKMGQNILGYVKEHGYKSGTPTMGGLIFVISAIIVFFLFLKNDGYLAVVCIAVGVSYMIVGGADDAIKIKLKRNEGLSPLQKTLFELVIAVVIALFSQYRGLTGVFVPFTKNFVDLGFWHFPLCVLVFIATTNSVNLTDGLDGLAGGVSWVYLAVIATLIYLQTKYGFAVYFKDGEYTNLVMLCCSLVGALIGYLLFNTFKASVFMGDTGSLSLGGFIASISMLSGNLFFIPILGITFVASSISVIVQVFHYKRTGKRVFLMAPLHHHFQHKGYSESKIVFAYKFVTFCVGTLCLISYL